MTDLLVMCPTRGRRELAERLLRSFEEHTVLNSTNLVFVTDPDDQETYEGMEWGEAQHGILDPRESLTGKLNRTADTYVNSFDALMFVADDYLFETPGWDDLMLRELARMGGTGMLYPEGKRRNDVPEIVLMSSDMVKVLGGFAEEPMKHYYLDNAWGEIGKRTGLLKFVPQVTIAHLHYQVSEETERDQTYAESEETWGQSDAIAYQYWLANRMPVQVSKLRRAFSKDVHWLLEKV